jgi:hypothetical protein
MSTTPNEKAEVPLGAYASPDEKKIAVGSIGSDSDDSHQYVTGEVFAQGGQLHYYEPIAKYEGRHRYDPAAQWTEAEEKRLVRRVRADSSSWFPIQTYLLSSLGGLHLILIKLGSFDVYG